MPEKVLISGATGFIAMHTVERLLAAGHPVVGTVRNPDAAEKVAPLRAMDGADPLLTLVAADLNDPDPFTAHADVDVIFHMASPFATDMPDPQRDLVDPAVNGTLAMMRAAAANPRVRRVVLTSSMAAIMDEPDDEVKTEAVWNTRSTLRRNPYYLAKMRGEQVAWAFMQAENPAFDLVVLNPFIVIGPSHTAVLNPSNGILAQIINGSFPGVLDLAWGFVDVRTVADAHIEAMRRPDAEGRHILTANPMSMADVCAIIEDLGYGAKMPKRNLTADSRRHSSSWPATPSQKESAATCELIWGGPRKSIIPKANVRWASDTASLARRSETHLRIWRAGVTSTQLSEYQVFACHCRCAASQ